MIPSHLSSLPCGSCRQPTITPTLRRIGNRFLCPLCREKAAAEVHALRAVEKKKLKPAPLGTWAIRMKKALSLGFLALAVTGFVVLPSLIDPSEIQSRSGSTVQVTGNGRLIHHSRIAG